MSYSAIIAKIAEKSNVDFALDFPVGLKTAYKTGGKADGVLFPSNSEQMKSVVYLLKESAVPYVVMGCGSNVLVSDRGYKGAVIFSENLKNITVRGKTIVAEAGVSLSELIKTALYSGLGGLEFLSGIPASVGGAVARKIDGRLRFLRRYDKRRRGAKNMRIRLQDERFQTGKSVDNFGVFHARKRRIRSVRRENRQIFEAQAKKDPEGKVLRKRFQKRRVFCGEDHRRGETQRRARRRGLRFGKTRKLHHSR